MRTGVSLALAVTVMVRAAGAAPATPAGDDRDTGPELAESWDPGLGAAMAALERRETAGAHRDVARHFVRLGVLDAAHRHFSDAIRLDRRDAESYEARARIWRDWGFPRLGVADAHRAVYYAPGWAGARNTLGTLLQAAGLRAEARRAYQAAADLDPSAAWALSNLCYSSLLDGRIDEAVDACRRALALDGELTVARNNLALAFALSGRIEEAEREFVRAAGPAAASYNLGLLYLAAGDAARARSAFDTAVRLSPAFELARVRARQAARLLAAPAGEEDHAGR